MALKSDNELFAEIKKGNKEAFDHIFLKYYENLCLYAYGILRDKYSAEEVVQEMFVRLWENRLGLTIELSVKSYFYRTVHNQCLNFLEHAKVQKKYADRTRLDSMPAFFPEPDTGHYPIANLLIQELEKKIESAITALPDQCRQVFLLCRYDELSYAETAKQLNISINTVKTQLQRAMSRLRDDLKEYFPVFMLMISLMRF